MHSKHMFYNVGLTASFQVQLCAQTKDREVDFRKRIHAACASVILHTPNLAATVSDELSLKPRFIHLSELDMNSCIFIHEDPIPDLDAFLEKQHNIPFPRKAPMWRLHIFHVTQKQESIEFLATFIFHHALGDGFSGLVFHRKLAAALAEQTQEDEDGVPSDPSLSPSGSVRQYPYSPVPPPLEELHSLPVTIPYTLNMICQHLWPHRRKQAFWAGNAISLPLISRFKSLQISASQTSKILNACRMYKTTVTAFLQELVAHILFMILPSNYYVLESVVAVSARPWIREGIEDDTMGLYVTSTFKTHTRPPQQSQGSEHAAAFNWEEARISTQNIQSFLKTQGKNNWLGLMKRYMKNIPKFLDSRVGKARELSFEISNLGVFDLQASNHPETVDIEQIVFSQTISAIDSAIQISVVTVKKNLSIGVSWQEGIVAEELILRFIDGMKDFLDSIAEHS